MLLLDLAPVFVLLFVGLSGGGGGAGMVGGIIAVFVAVT
jgi:hypothetical protein